MLDEYSSLNLGAAQGVVSDRKASEAIWVSVETVSNHCQVGNREFAPADVKFVEELGAFQYLAEVIDGVSVIQVIFRKAQLLDVFTFLMDLLC